MISSLFIVPIHMNKKITNDPSVVYRLHKIGEFLRVESWAGHGGELSVVGHWP